MTDKAQTAASLEDLRITVLYDNYPHQAGLETAWGFACVIQGTEKTILFDTGGDGKPLLENMNACGIGMQDIDIVVISHQHWDHRGGLYHVLAEKGQVSLFVPSSFSEHYKEDVRRYGCEIVNVQEPLEICPHIYSTGDLEGKIREQALVLQTPKGSIVMTGCAHPGIVNIIRKAKDVVQDDLLLVLGGFHLMNDKQDSIENVVSEFKRLGVRNVAPTHCSGDLARKIFAKEFQGHCLPIGVGTVIEGKDLA